MLVCAQRNPMTLQIDHLKKWLECTEKYHQTRDFLKRVIDPAIKELDKLGANSFQYERKFNGNKVCALLIKPVNRQSMQHTPADKARSWGALSSEEIKRMLICDAGFTIHELENNKRLLSAIEEHPFALDIVQMVMHHAQKKNAGKGYIINALKSELGLQKRA